MKNNKINIKSNPFKWKHFSIGILMTKKGANADGIEIKNKFGWRAKMGTQYNCTNNIAFRALLTYQRSGNKLKFDNNEEYKFIKDMKSIGLSTIYTF